MIWQIYFWFMLILIVSNAGYMIAKHGKQTEVNGWTTLISTLFWIPAFFIMFNAIFK